MSAVGLIICGALAHEVIDLVDRHGWDVDVTAVPAQVHVRPEQIAPKVQAKIEQWRGEKRRIIVGFGDCGSAGALDALLADYPEIERLRGPHCYDWYGGDLFHDAMTEEPGTFFLTDFMVRTFRNMIWKGMGLDRRPELRDIYFANYKRVLYLTQRPHPDLLEKARAAAHMLQLPLEVRATGYGGLETQLRDMLAENEAKPAPRT